MVLHPLPGVRDALPVCVILRSSESLPFPWQEVAKDELRSTANFMIAKCKGERAIHGNTTVPGQGNGRHITHRAPDRQKMHWTDSLLSHMLDLEVPVAPLGPPVLRVTSAPSPSPSPCVHEVLSFVTAFTHPRGEFSTPPKEHEPS